MAVDALVEVDQTTVVAAGLVERLQQRDDGGAIVVGAALGREPGGVGLEREPHLRETGQVAAR